MSNEAIHDEVRQYYRKAAQSRAQAPAVDDRWGSSRYDSETLESASSAAAVSSTR